MRRFLTSMYSDVHVVSHALVKRLWTKVALVLFPVPENKFGNKTLTSYLDTLLYL